MTVVEIARIDLREHGEAGFEHAFAEAKPLIERAPGCHGARLYRGIGLMNGTNTGKRRVRLA